MTVRHRIGRRRGWELRSTAALVIATVARPAWAESGSLLGPATVFAWFICVMAFSTLLAVVVNIAPLRHRPILVASCAAAFSPVSTGHTILPLITGLFGFLHLDSAQDVLAATIMAFVTAAIAHVLAVCWYKARSQE